MGIKPIAPTYPASPTTMPNLKEFIGDYTMENYLIMMGQDTPDYPNDTPLGIEDDSPADFEEVDEDEDEMEFVDEDDEDEDDEDDDE